MITSYSHVLESYLKIDHAYDWLFEAYKCFAKLGINEIRIVIIDNLWKHFGYYWVEWAITTAVFLNKAYVFATR